MQRLERLHVARELASRYLRATWPAVRRIAYALLSEGTLSGYRLCEIAGDLPRVNLEPLAHNLVFWSKRARARETARAGG